MKAWTITILAALLLAACGQEESQPASTDTAAPVAEETTPAPESTPVETVGDEAVQVVEESAAVETETAAEDETLMLARADTPAPSRDWKFSEGEHYARLTPTQPTWGGADKIEVAEFFWYGCPHCYDFEPYINRWETQKDAGVRLVRIPAMWNPLLEKHARLFFVEQIFARNGDIEDPARFRDIIFQEYHRRGNRLTSDDAIYALFNRVGISREDFDKTWKSFEVEQNIRKAGDLARRYGVNSVPMVIVNGKYRTSASGVGSYPELIELIDELTEREGL